MKAYINSKRAIRRRVLRALQPCREIVPLMSESLERRLGVMEQLQLKLHLMVCVWCARYLKQIKFLRELVRQRTFAAANDTATPVALPAEAPQRIFRSLKDLEGDSATQTRQILANKSCKEQPFPTTNSLNNVFVFKRRNEIMRCGLLIKKRRITSTTS